MSDSLDDRLGDCKTRQEVESVFNDLKMYDFSSRINALNSIMGNPETFSSSELQTDELRYQREVSIFLTGVWKLNQYYERAGL